jgi:MOSC domain-containing protein YiiM
MRPLQEAEFDDAGLVGDEHRAQGSIRQLLLEDEETVDALGLAPGQVKENVTLRGVDVNGLPAGTLLFIGHTVVEITKECSPCDRMEEIRSGLKADLVGRRGVYARVVAGGTVRVGDPVFIRETAPGIPRPAS